MNLFEQHRKQRIAAFLASMAVASFGVVGAADTSNVATENATYVDITINNVKEDSGLELGNNARARGNGSIATGTNSLAIGKNAVATGGNETKDTITNKLNENRQRLQEIQTAQDTADRLMKELDSIRKKEADVIEAGERVKQVRQAKEKAKQAWQDKLAAYNNAVQDSSAQLKDAQSKIDDLNSRLTGVSKISGVNISSDEGLTHAATQLKAIAEEGTTLNLSVDFYKDYVSSYYKALGDLRQNQIIHRRTDPYMFRYDYYATLSSSKDIKNGYSGLPALRAGISYDRGGLFFGSYATLNSNAFVGDSTITAPEYSIQYKSIDTQVTSQEEWSHVQTAAPQFKKAMEIYFTNTNDPFLSDEARQSAIARFNKNVDYYVKINEITYYQGQYEATKDTTWLDKKATALNELTQIEKEYNALPSPITIRRAAIDAWYKENIIDIQDKNKITTDTLTSELEKALGINKNAIQDIENNLAKLKTASDQAKSTYDNTNPSAADIALSQRYNEVMRDLLNKSNSLKAQQERLEALRQALTLHDLSDVGENAMAIGTDALSTGTNSVALGTNTIATGENAIAIGKGSAVTGTDSIAIGTGHIVIGNNAGTFGDPNTIYADNSYAIGNNNTIGSSATPHTVGTNTFVLGNNVTTTANNAVILGTGSVGKDNAVSVGKPGAERQIINVAAGTLSSTSTDAVNGSQLYATNQSISNLENAIKNSSAKDMLAVHYDKDTPTVTLQKTTEKPYVILKVMDGPNRFITQRVYLNEEGHFIQNPVISDAPNGYVHNTDFRTTFRDLDPNATYTPGQEIITKVYFVKSTEWLPGLPGEGEAPPEYTPDTSDKITGFKLYDDPGKTEDISHPVLTVTDTTPVTIKNLADGAIKEGSKEAINGGQLYTALAGKADKDASNITGADKTKWQETLGDGKAEAGNKGLVTGDTLNTELSKKADKTDITNINADLANKANKDASNITGTDKTKWQEALGDGKAEAGNKGLVNGDTLNTELNKKANTDLSNITKEGQTVIQNLAKGSVKVVAGTNTTVTKGTDGDATTYAVNVSADAIKGAVQGDLDSKANKDASNLSTTDVTKWQETLGNGKAEAGNKGLINGDTLNTELNKKADKTDITNINADLTNKANKDASNISTDDAKKWAEKLGTGTVTKGDTSLVTGDTVYNTTINKANTDMDNLTDTGKTVIQNLAKDSVKVIAGKNTTVTTGKDGDATTYAVNVSKDDIKAAVQSDLDAKANRDASNLTATDVKSWQDALSHGGKVEAGNTSLITGDTVYNVVKNIELSAEKLVTTDGQTTYIDKNGTSTTIDVSHVGKDGKPEGRVIQGVVTDVDNPTSVVNVGTMSNALENLNANVGSQINALDRKLTKDVKHAGATAAALAALNPLPYDASNKLNFAVGQGRYRGENATALGVFYQPNENISISLGGTISSGDKAMNAGVSFRVGSGNAAKKTVKQSEFDALKAENKAMAERLDSLQKQIEGLKAINLATADRKPFPDVPENHWAAEAVETLHANDVVEGYEDGEFKGDKTMTRYEYAQMLYKAAHKA